MGVSRSRDDYRLGKPIIHAAISPFPLLLYGCSALSIIFLVSLSLSPSLASFFFLSSTRPSLFILTPSSSSSTTSARSMGSGSGPFSQEEGSLLAFSTGEPCLFLPYGYDFGKKSFCTEERERERKIVGRPPARGLYPLSSIQSRTSIRL